MNATEHCSTALPTRPAPNADPTTIAAILARSLPAGHPYIAVDADPLARLVPLTDAQRIELAAQREAMEAAEYERLTRRARRHPNGIKTYKARQARSQANSISWSWWKAEAYRLRREAAQAIVDASVVGETRTPLCPSCGDEIVSGGNWAGGNDYLCMDCYAEFERDMAEQDAMVAAVEAMVAA